MTSTGAVRRRDSSPSPVVIVGEQSDPHLREVADRIPVRWPLVIFDTASIACLTFAVSAAFMRVETANGHGAIHLDHSHRGWIRRPAPADWDLGVMAGSKPAVVKSAWRALVVALLRNPACTWLTPLDPLLAAENKVVQYRTARRIGIDVPPMIVTNDARTASSVGQDVIAKPLGSQQFWITPDDTRIVFANAIDMNDPTVVELLHGAPFIVQQRLTAVRHLRVVTVCEQAWAFELSAAELPLDWRENVTAHSSWKYTTLPEIERRAVDLSAAMTIRYSSQDWIETTGGTYFIDLNPGGQWLFLPDPQAAQISVAISEWLQSGANVDDDPAWRRWRT